MRGILDIISMCGKGGENMGARSAVDRRETRPNGERESPLRLRRARKQRFKFRKLIARGTD